MVASPSPVTASPSFSGTNQRDRAPHAPVTRCVRAARNRKNPCGFQLEPCMRIRHTGHAHSKPLSSLVFASLRPPASITVSESLNPEWVS